MQARRSLDPHRLSLGSTYIGDREGLIRAYDEEESAGFGLTDLAEESGSDSSLGSPDGKVNGNGNGALPKPSFTHPEQQEQTKSPLQR